MMMQNSQGFRGVTLSYDDHAKESQGISGVTLAYDDDDKDFWGIIMMIISKRLTLSGV